MAHDASEAKQAAEDINSSSWVVKAQILAGGRGKAGGVRVAETPQAVAETAQQMLGMNLVTPQTGPRGTRVSRVHVEEGIRCKKEYMLK